MSYRSPVTRVRAFYRGPRHARFSRGGVIVSATARGEESALLVLEFMMKLAYSWAVQAVAICPEPSGADPSGPVRAPETARANGRPVGMTTSMGRRSSSDTSAGHNIIGLELIAIND